MSGSDAIKKYQTNIKSAQGTVVLAVILNLIYIIKAFISKNLNFWFGTYLTEFMFKASGFVPDYEGSFPKWLAVLLVLIEAFAILIPALMTEKNGKSLYICLAVYAADTVFLAVGSAMNFFGDFVEADFIDVIFHLFVLLFIVGGIYSHKKLRELMVTQETK